MFKKEIIIIIILISIALVRFLFFIPDRPPFDSFINKTVSLTGFVKEDPDVRLKNKQLIVRIEGYDANILIFIRREEEVSYGDIVKIKGILKQPENFTTNSGKEFNYKRYLANKDIYFMVQNGEIELVSKGNGNKIKSFLYRIKNSFINNINRVVPTRESELANGLLLGTNGSFDNETEQDFIETGTAHIVALSGYNVSIVADSIMRSLGLIFSQTISTVSGIFVILLFIITTGASSTAIRAGIMASIMLLGKITGRRYLAGRALLIAGLIMVSYDPRILTNMSFQLSFIATFGVLFVTPKVIKWFKFVPMRFGLREMVATTFAATISVLPLLLYLTGVLSLISIFTNLLILPFIPLAMLLSFFTGAIGFISSIISIPIGFLSYVILKYILSIINIFGSFHYASIIVTSFPLFLVIISYILLLIWIKDDIRVSE